MTSQHTSSKQSIMSQTLPDFDFHRLNFNCNCSRQSRGTHRRDVKSTTELIPDIRQDFGFSSRAGSPSLDAGKGSNPSVKRKSVSIQPIVIDFLVTVTPLSRLSGMALQFREDRLAATAPLETAEIQDQ